MTARVEPLDPLPPRRMAETLAKVEARAEAARADAEIARIAWAQTQPQRITPDTRARALRIARKILLGNAGDAAPQSYPVEALEPLAPACKAIAEHGQVRPALAGQALLGAASLLTQGLYNVATLNGPRPLSLYLLTLGDSGDGKSTAQRAALHEVEEWQREAAKQHRGKLRAIQSEPKKKGDPPPELPAPPYRLIRDATVEGLRRDLDTGTSSQGVFTDEAAAILSGYGMSAEHRSKTAGVFSQLWDAGRLSVSRATGGRIERYGKRLAMHWLIQPAGASEAVNDAMLSELGFWPRFLLAWPPAAEPRKQRPFEPGDLPAVRYYWQRCRELLSEPLPEDADRCDVLPLTGEAAQMLGAAFDRFEHEARKGSLSSVKPFALRASEQAARVAGVLTAFAGARAVSAETMAGALALVGHSVEAWRRIIEQGEADQESARALRLYEWLTDPKVNPSGSVQIHGVHGIARRGPRALRSASVIERAIDALETVGLAEVDDGHLSALIPSESEG